METKTSLKLSRKDYFRALMAGVAIGIANCTVFRTENIYVGAFLYSFYALLIAFFKLKLFTNQIGYWTFHPGAYIEMIILNFIGSTVALAPMMKKGNIEGILYTCKEAYDKPWFVIITLGFICGIVAHVGFETKDRLLIIIAVMIIIVRNLRHCVIDFTMVFVTFLMTKDMSLIGKFILVIIGNILGSTVIHAINNYSRMTDED